MVTSVTFLSLGNECCERLAYYGMSSNLVLYFKHRLHQHSATASRNNLNWSGTCYITPLIGAFIADSYLGRYRTIAVFSIIYVIGMSLLTMSASIPGLRPTCYSKDDCRATDAESAVFFLALYIVALGTGGIKPCVSSFGADQFDDDDEVEKKQKSSFFNWFYFVINIGALIASSVLVWVQENVSWGLGFGIPAVAMGIAVISFFSGTRLYRNQKPGGSPLTRLAQVMVSAFRKYNVPVPLDRTQLYETADAESNIKGSRKLDHTEDLKFFDKAAVVTQTQQAKDSAVNPWRLCTVTQVEELKGIIRLLPIWATGITFSAVYSQMGSLFVLQGETLDASMGPHFEIPSASLSIFDTLSVIIWIPIYDRIIVPTTRRYTGHKNGLTQLQRMGVGLIISILAMLAAGTLELIRLDIVKRNNFYDYDHIPMSIFWQIPQYFLIGCGEVFFFVGQMEFFYMEAPDAMRSLCSALALTTVALGNYASSLLVTIVTKVSTKHGRLGWIPDNLNRGHLHYFFLSLAILSVVNLGAFLVISKCSASPIFHSSGRRSNTGPKGVAGEENPNDPDSTDSTNKIKMVRKRYEPPKTGWEWFKSINYDKYFDKIGAGKRHYLFWKQFGKGLMYTYALAGACWWYNETSPLGWWSLKVQPKEEQELAHLYERREFPYPGDKEAMDEFITKGGMIGTAIGPKGIPELDKDSFNFHKELQDKKLNQEAQKLWLRMRNEVISELHQKGLEIE
uniref:Uncharacterized protein n=1 Tax=Cannabis sativa TaxID=3483 RepID=A0A803PUZ4_CANSA